MNILELLANATVVDTDGYMVGENHAFHIVHGTQLIITIDVDGEEEPEDPDKEEIPEETVAESIMRVVSGG